MTLRYLLDTNTLSEPLKPQAVSQVVSNLTVYEHEIATAAQVVYEMIQGAYRLPESAKKRAEVLRYLDEFVATIPILPYDEATAAMAWSRTSATGKVRTYSSFYRWTNSGDCQGKRASVSDSELKRF